MFRFFEYAKLVFFLDMHKFRAKTFGSSGILRSALNTVLLISQERDYSAFICLAFDSKVMVG